VLICPIVRGEILYGIERLSPGLQRRNLEAKSTALFAAIACEGVPEAAGDQYALVKVARTSKGLAMDENNLWIDATALALGATLVSRDADVRQVDGLSVIDWSQ
jgi:predicted nucleic acid-binding protein